MNGSPHAIADESRQIVVQTGRPGAMVKPISVVVTVAGLAVMAGWIFDVGALKSIMPAMISMKFSTAIAFVLSGVTLYFLAEARTGEFETAQIALSITSLIMTLLMGTLFFSAVFNVQTGIEDLFIKETGGVQSVAPGRPSVPTMVNFMLIAAAAVMTVLNFRGLVPGLRIIGGTTGIIGALAVIGYIFNVPILFFYIEGVNSAMALHTAILFVLLGTGLV